MSVVLFKHKFINSCIKKGCKVEAEEMFFDLLAQIKLITEGQPLLKFYKTLSKLAPIIDLRSVKRGGIIYRMPVFARKFSRKGIKLVNGWLIRTTYNKTRLINFDLLVNNILDSLTAKGLAYDQKLLLYKTGVDNRPFLKFNRKANLGWTFQRALRRRENKNARFARFKYAMWRRRQLKFRYRPKNKNKLKSTHALARQRLIKRLQKRKLRFRLNRYRKVFSRKKNLFLRNRKWVRRLKRSFRMYRKFYINFRKRRVSLKSN